MNKNDFHYAFIDSKFTQSHIPRFRDYMANYKLVKNNSIMCVEYTHKISDFVENFENFKIENANTINKDTPVIYINLDSNHDRKKNIQELLNDIGFKNINRFSAVNTKTWENLNNYKDYIDKNAYSDLIETHKNKERKHHYDLTLGAVGCYLSFYKIFQEMVQKNTPLTFICEDDLKLNCDKNHFWKIMDSLNIPKEFDMLLINSLYNDISIKNGINNVTFFMCTTFMIVTLEGAKNMLKHLTPIQCQLDTALSRLAFDKKIKIYGIHEPSLKLDRNSFGSDIQNTGCEKCNLGKEIRDYKNKNNS